MAGGLSASVQDNGLNHMKNNAAALHLVDGFDPDVHDRAWVIANSKGNAPLSSASFTGPANGPVSGRRLTMSSVSGSYTASLAAGAGDLWFVVVSATEVLGWSDETSERQLTSGQPMTAPAIPFGFKE